MVKRLSQIPLIGLFLAVLATGTQAQSTTPTLFQSGLRIGAGTSVLQRSDHAEDSDDDPAFSWTAGIGLRRPLSNRVSFETGLLYSRRGGDRLTNGPVERFNQIWEGQMETWTVLHYIVVPARIRIGLSPTGPSQLYFKGGFDLAMLGGSSVNGEGSFSRRFGNSVARLLAPTDNQADVDRFDLGLGLDVGYEFPVGEQFMFFEIGGTLGLVDIEPESDRLRSHSLTASLGFWLQRPN